MKCDNCNQEAFYETPTLRLCEACFKKKFYASFSEMERRGLIERHGEKWRITEKGRDEESSWDEAWEAAELPGREQMAEKEPCFRCGKESVMTLTFAGAKRRACNDCGKKLLEEIKETGSDIAVSVGGKLVNYVPSKQLQAEVKEKAKTGRLMCAYCSRRIATAELAGFRVYIPHDMKGRHPYVLCPSCETKVTAGDKGILEAVEEKIESGSYKLDEESRGYELSGQPIAKGPVCFKCGGVSLIGYSYRGNDYCHECFRPIADMVNEADEKAPEKKPDDYLFWPTADEETRLVTARWIMADALLKMDRPDIAYAWLKCGFVRPGIMKNAKIKPYRIPRDLRHDEVLHWNTPSRLTEDETLQWDNAIKEYRERTKRTIPASDQWMIVLKLENGETSVASRRGCLDVSTHEEAKQFLNLKLRPGAMGYTPDGGLYGSAELLGDNIIRAVEYQAIPRSDYNPKKHDTFHLRLGPTRKESAHMNSVEAVQGKGLLADYTRPGTAFDVMDSLDKVLETTSDYGLRKILREAHPIVWTPQMTMTAYEAVCQLKDALTVEADVMFINPALWLFTVPIYEGCPAQDATEPFAEDGHIPFPDELVGDLGAPVVAILFNLTDTEITGWYFYLLKEEPMKLETRHTHLSLGSQPTKIEEQTTLKWLRFAASPYLIVAPHRVERHIRRRVESRFPQVSTGVGVILLRRAERLYEAGEHPGEAEAEWSCQWWVSGHWRRQWYPSTKTHKPVWIAPYIKGPPDKPLKESVRLMIR